MKLALRDAQQCTDANTSTRRRSIGTTFRSIHEDPPKDKPNTDTKWACSGQRVSAAVTLAPASTSTGMESVAGPGGSRWASFPVSRGTEPGAGL